MKKRKARLTGKTGPPRRRASHKGLFRVNKLGGPGALGGPFVRHNRAGTCRLFFEGFQGGTSEADRAVWRAPGAAGEADTFQQGFVEKAVAPAFRISCGLLAAAGAQRKRLLRGTRFCSRAGGRVVVIQGSSKHRKASEQEGNRRRGGFF